MYSYSVQQSKIQSISQNWFKEGATPDITQKLSGFHDLHLLPLYFVPLLKQAENRAAVQRLSLGFGSI